jgi:drug/metabolite transporter (DMT)-like permease
MTTAQTPGAERAEGFGVAFAALSATAFGTVAIVAKLAYDEGAGPLPLLAVRFLVAAVLLYFYQLATRCSPWIGRRDVVRLVLLGGVCFAFESSLFFTALTLAPAGVVSLVFFSYPLMTVILGFALGRERLRRPLLIALALGSMGVVSIFSFSNASTAGLLLALGSALAVAIYYLLAEELMKGIEPSVGAMWTSAGAGVAMTIVSVASGQRFPVGALPAAGALGAATVIAFVCLYAAIHRMGSSKTAVAQMLEPVVTVLLAAIFLSEGLELRTVIGAALIISALPILATEGRHNTITPAPDSL